MRTVGIFAHDRGGVENFLHRLRRSLDDRLHQRVRIILQPTHDPKIGVMILEGCRPGIQCATAPDGSFAIIDGEVYDDEDSLSEPVSGGTRSASAAERLLKDYRSNGISAMARLNATAISVIWDADRAALLISRDRYGGACVFFSDLPGAFIWSTDAGTLLRTGISCSIDHESVDFFLAAGYVPAPWTPIKQIRKLPPGHALYCKAEVSPRIEPYWRPTGRPKLHISPVERTERLRELLKTALRRRYGAPGHTGVLLSSGVDSTLVAAVYTKLLDLPIDTFTFRYEQYDGPFNECLAARRRAEYLGTAHHEIRVGPSDIESGLETMVRNYGEPFTYGLHSFKIGDAIEAKMSTLVSGVGIGDLYPSRGDMLARRYAHLPSALHSLLRVAVPYLRFFSAAVVYKANNLHWGVETGLPGNTNVPITSDAIRLQIYRDKSHAMGHRAIALHFVQLVASLHDESDRDQIVLLLQRFFISECNLYWYNRWGSSHDVSFRFPYYDNDFQEFVMRLPRKGKNKADMRELAADLMPRDMAYAPKVYHTIPIRQWFRGPLKGMLRSHLSRRRILDGGLFDPVAVDRLVDAHIQGRANYEWTLWCILTINSWQDLLLRL